MSSRSPDGVFYLTTPIYYINGPPHLGHAYTTLVADTMARYRRLAGDDVWFLTGTDEHGDKIAQAAAKAGETPQALADRNSKAFRDQWDALGITHDDFIRTTEPRHARVVQAVLQALFEKGEIYFGKYGGQYCFGCERFYTDKEIVDGKCPDHQTPLTYIEEENYFFRMSAYQGWLRRYLEEHPDVVQPDRYRNELLGFLREPLQDLSISRPKSRLQWGIPLPFDDRFVTYVWFDALLNYVSALGGPGGDRFRRYWPHVHHLIGKDILKPHGVYWPCMLKAAGLLRDEVSGDASLPGFARLRVHGYWTLGGGKISKSVGNVVEALALTRKYGNDAFRYFVLREMPFGQDASFSEEALVDRLNADLANDLGNLVSRATTLIAAHGAPGATANGRVLTPDFALSDAFDRTRRVVDESMAEFAFHRALVAIWEFIAVVNRYVDSQQPWALAKDPAQTDRLIDVLVTLADALRCLGIVLLPFLPDAAERIRKAMGDAEKATLEAAVFGRMWRIPDDLRGVQKLTGLFPRVDVGKEGTPPRSSGSMAAKTAKGASGPAARITIDEFKRLDLRVAEVVAAEAVPKSKKLLKLTVRLDEETRTLVAGIAEHYRPEALVGRKVVVVANLEPATLMGVTSNGMVLAGSAGEALALLALDRDLPSGAKVR
jgi:methionyl-tRNA synthetase